MAAPASFARHLPYWTTLDVPVSSAATGAAATHRCVLVLKNGTLAVGVTFSGRDVYASGNEELNAQCEGIAEALSEMPAEMFAQVEYASGRSFAPLLQRYGSRGRADSHPLLRHGRAERQAMLEECAYLTRCTITLWLGLKEAVPAMARVGASRQRPWWYKLFMGKASPGGLDAASIRRAGQGLIKHSDAFLAVMARSGLEGSYMSESAILSACHQAINPSLGPEGALQYVQNEDDMGAYAAGASLVLPGPTLSSQLPLSALRYNDTQLVLGEPPLIQRVLGVCQLGPTTNPKSLFGLLYDELPQTPMRLVITHEASDTEVRREQLARRQRFISSFIGSQFIDHGARAALEEHDEVLAELDARGGKLFQTSMLVVVSGADVDAVERASRHVIDGLSRQRIAATVHHEQQLTAWLASLPAYGTTAPNKHAVLHHNCAHLWPYWIPSTGDAEPDLLFENRQRGIEGLSVRLGPVRENAGAVIVGATNSGKTFLFSTLFKYGCLDLGGHVVLADIKGPANSSYRPLCQLFGGTYVCLDNEPDVSFNPFPPHHEVFAADGSFQPQTVEASERILCMMTVPNSAVDPDSAYARSVARDVIKAAYMATATSAVPEGAVRPAAKQVILSDVISAFKTYQGRNAKLCALAESMSERLELWLEDPTRARLFNRPKSLELGARFIVFDFYNMDKDKEMAAVLISVLASRIEAKMTTLPKTMPKLFGFDEAWALFQQSPEACALLDRLYRVARSYGAFCYVLTQSWADIETSAAKTGIISNTSLLYLMRHMAHQQETARALELTDRQQELFRSLEMVAGRYAEFLLIDKHENKTHLLQYAPTGFDLWCDTSRAADVAFRDRAIRAGTGSLVETIEALAQQFPQGAPKDAPEHEADIASSVDAAGVAGEA